MKDLLDYGTAIERPRPPPDRDEEEATVAPRIF